MHQPTTTTPPLAWVREGARTAVRTCLNIGPADRVFILTDDATLTIGTLLAEEAAATGAAVVLRRLEEYGPRPLTALPPRLREDLLTFRPTATFYAASARPGEIAFRIELLPFLTREIGARHGHMPGIPPRLMAEGLRTDYQTVARLTWRVTGIVRQARQIAVTSPAGTVLVARFSPARRWVPCPGLYHQPGQWGNLPEGETFTAPEAVEGLVAASVLGDFFSEKYGVLPEPVLFEIVDSRLVDIQTASATLRQELWDYLTRSENGTRVGEFAIGTNIGLRELTGNLLQDEKLPGVHLAFGNPYPHETGADWTARVHVDVIPTRCTVYVDGRPLLRDGQFVDLDRLLADG